LCGKKNHRPPVAKKKPFQVLRPEKKSMKGGGGASLVGGKGPCLANPPPLGSYSRTKKTEKKKSKNGTNTPPKTGPPKTIKNHSSCGSPKKKSGGGTNPQKTKTPNKKGGVWVGVGGGEGSPRRHTVSKPSPKPPTKSSQTRWGFCQNQTVGGTKPYFTRNENAGGHFW